MSKRGSLSMTRAEVIAHCEKNKLPVPSELAEKILGAPLQPWQKAILDGPPKPRMNKTELAYARILEAKKQRGEIFDYKFEGISLSWGADPKTGKPMWYTPDFIVWETGSIFHHLIEVKGAHIWSRDLVRFKGCRAEWGLWFIFEMHQKKGVRWTKVM